MQDTQEWARWTEQVSDEALISQWSLLIRHIALTAKRTYTLSNEDAADIQQYMTLKLLQVSPDKRYYEQYCRAVLNNAVRSAVRDLSRRGATPQDRWQEHRLNTMSYAAAAPTIDRDGEEDAASALDRITDATNPEPGLCDSIVLRDALETLNERERKVIALLYWDGLTLTQTADALGLSVPTIGAARKSALAKLRKAIAKG